MKNRFKFVCLDCKAESWLLKKEMIRSSKPRCPSCGSLYLEASAHSVANERITSGQLARDVQAYDYESRGYAPKAHA